MRIDPTSFQMLSKQVILFIAFFEIQIVISPIKLILSKTHAIHSQQPWPAYTISIIIMNQELTVEESMRLQKHTCDLTLVSLSVYQPFVELSHHVRGSFKSALEALFEI